MQRVLTSLGSRSVKASLFASCRAPSESVDIVGGDLDGRGGRLVLDVILEGDVGAALVLPNDGSLEAEAEVVVTNDHHGPG
eukprot:4845478-Pyramimonas_sp.AAC.1